MESHVFLLPDGDQLFPDDPIGDAVLRLAVPVAPGEQQPFERTGETDFEGRVVWKPVPGTRLAVEAAQRAAWAMPAPPAPEPEDVSVEFVPGELEAMPSALRCQHFIRRCAYAMEEGQLIQMSREMLLQVLGKG